MDRVKEKVIIVTGGARGIGRATAKLLAKEGAVVVIADIAEDDAEKTAREITADGGRASCVRHDVREEADWKSLVAHVKKASKRIDVLVNNAGVYLIKDLKKTSLEAFEAIMATNARGVFLGMKYCAPVMAERKKGSIINLSSMDGNVGSEGHVAYGGSKGAVRTMTKHAAIEYAKQGVRVNSIHPGYIDTDMAKYAMKVYGENRKELGEEFPLGHIGEPMDVAYGVLYLASDESKFVTGAELAIDGGAMAK
jgi:NAD(P)-dependent dehydrogenase (short-subunit alcohol dehydrogenase family)